MDDVNSERLGREKRKYVRMEVAVKATFEIVGDEEKTVFKAWTKDISHSGARNDKGQWEFPTPKRQRSMGIPYPETTKVKPVYTSECRH